MGEPTKPIAARPPSPEGWPFSGAHAPHGVRIPPRNADFSKLSLAERNLWYIEYQLPEYQALADSGSQTHADEDAELNALLAAHLGAVPALAQAPR